MMSSVLFWRTINWGCQPEAIRLLIDEIFGHRARHAQYGRFTSAWISV